MWVLLVSLWYLSGIVFYLMDEYIYWEEITIGDVMFSFFVGIIGPLILLKFVNWNYPIYRKKQK